MLEASFPGLPNPAGVGYVYNASTWAIPRHLVPERRSHAECHRPCNLEDDKHKACLRFLAIEGLNEFPLARLITGGAAEAIKKGLILAHMHFVDAARACLFLPQSRVGSAESDAVKARAKDDPRQSKAFAGQEHNGFNILVQGSKLAPRHGLAKIRRGTRKHTRLAGWKQKPELRYGGYGVCS